MRIAAWTAAGLGEPVIFDTPQRVEEGLARFAEEARRLAGSEPIERVVAGLPGVLWKEKTTLFRAPHLPAWEGVDIAARLRSELGAPVVLENDTALNGLGEAYAGAGVGFPIVAYITVSTGVGGVRIVDGAIDHSAQGFEIGHQYLFLHGHDNANAQTIESLVSGSALQERTGKHPLEITDPDVWEESARLFAYALHNTILHWSPHCVVLGGSMFKEGGISIPRVQKHLQGIMHMFPQLPEIRHASLGDIAGLHGALAVAQRS